MSFRLLLAMLAFLCLAMPALSPAALAEGAEAATPIDPGKLLVRPKGEQAQAPAAPAFWSDPVGWIQVKQRDYYGRMSGALRAMRGEHAWSAAFTLMLLSFGYGVLHAAGPGHGKAVVSAWLLANEREVKRGIFIASLSAIFQALTAIVLVSVVLLTVSAAGSTARSIAGSLESASYALIALLGLYMVWQVLKPRPALEPALAGGHHHHDHERHEHGHDRHRHHHGEHHNTACGCGDAHMPAPEAVKDATSLGKAVSLAFAVGLRPCTGAILALLFSSAIGLYWAGIASTFVMALGTAITVSAIAVLAVTSRGLALKLAGRDSAWLGRAVKTLKLAGGIAIALLGALLFLGSLSGSAYAQVTEGDDAPLRFGRFEHEGKASYGVLAVGGVHELDKSFLEPGVKVTGRVFKLEEVKLLPPIIPSKVIGIARNYKSHGGEKGEEPGFFAKLPSALIGSGAEIVPPPKSSDLHLEGEMVIVIGAQAKNVKAAEARDVIFGVTAGNDVTERSYPFEPFSVLRSKGFDTSGPLGPWIVPGLAYDQLRLKTRLNGKIVQEASTKDMIFDTGEIVETVSRYITLEPGDLIYTGTPGTMSPIKPGDVVEVELDGVGVLKNTVAEPRVD